MTTEPTVGADAIDRANATFWQHREMNPPVLGGEPLMADDSFAVPDLTDDEWEAFTAALRE